MYVSFVCCYCGKHFTVKVSAPEYDAYQSGTPIQLAMPKRDPFFREQFVSSTCYDCQSKIFHRPKPGESWGEILGECVCCGATIYEKDNGVCAQCGTPISTPTECGCVECGACEVTKGTGIVQDHNCRCNKCEECSKS